MKNERKLIAELEQISKMLNLLELSLEHIFELAMEDGGELTD